MGTIMRNGIAYGGGIYNTTPVVALAGATSVTIQDNKITANSKIIPFADNGTNVPMKAPSSITLTSGQCVLTFDALESNTSFTIAIIS